MASYLFRGFGVAQRIVAGYGEDSIWFFVPLDAAELVVNGC